MIHPEDLGTALTRWQEARDARRHLRDRVPLPPRGRRVPLAAGTRAADPRRRGHGQRLGRHGHRHRGPQADGGAGALPRRGRLGARQLARLRADAGRRRAPGDPAGRGLVRGRHLRQRPARACRARARRPAEARARARARPADARSRGGGRRHGDPLARAGARARDRRGGARHVRLRRAPARDRPSARAALVCDRPAHRPRRGLRHDQPRHGGVRPRLRRGRRHARAGARPARRRRDRQRAPLRRVGAPRPRHARARRDRRRRRHGRRRGDRPALEPGGVGDHGAARPGRARAATSRRCCPAGTGSSRASRSARRARRLAPRRSRSSSTAASSGSRRRASATPRARCTRSAT